MNLPDDILTEIFTYLVGYCDYDNFIQYNILKLSMPDIAYIYHNSLSIQKKGMNLNSHLHFRYKETNIDLCGYVYEPFILELYTELIKLISRRRKRSSKTRKKKYSTRKQISNNMTVHPISDIPAFYQKHMKSIIDDFCYMCNVTNLTFSHLCCGGSGIVCDFGNPHHIA